MQVRGLFLLRGIHWVLGSFQTAPLEFLFPLIETLSLPQRGERLTQLRRKLPDSGVLPRAMQAISRRQGRRGGGVGIFPCAACAHVTVGFWVLQPPVSDSGISPHPCPPQVIPVKSLVQAGCQWNNFFCLLFSVFAEYK